MICVSVAGCILGGVLYLTEEVPGHDTGAVLREPPANDFFTNDEGAEIGFLKPPTEKQKEDMCSQYGICQ